MTRIYELLPTWEHPKLHDAVLDLTAIEQGWLDWKGEVVEEPGSNIKVRYTSGTERWKMDANLIRVTQTAYKCAIKRVLGRGAYPYSPLRFIQTFCPDYIAISDGPGQITTIIFLSKSSYEIAKKYMPDEAGHYLNLIEEINPTAKKEQ